MEERVLTVKERAFILDKIGNTSFFYDEFGELDAKMEKELVDSIFKKLELTYYLPAGYKYFKLNYSDFSEEEAKKSLENLEVFKKMFEDFS